MFSVYFRHILEQQSGICSKTYILITQHISGCFLLDKNRGNEESSVMSAPVQFSADVNNHEYVAKELVKLLIVPSVVYDTNYTLYTIHYTIMTLCKHRLTWPTVPHND